MGSISVVSGWGVGDDIPFWGCLRRGDKAEEGRGPKVLM